jgi:hypothetical protein
MTNVIPFRRDRGASPEEAQPPAPRIDAAKLRRHSATIARGAGGFAFGIVRLALFLPLLWLRRPIRFLLGLAIFGLFLAMPMIWFGMADANPQRTTLFAAAAGSWFGLLVFLWCYDSLLMRLSPTPIILN